MTSLEKYKISQIPESIYCIPDFVSQNEEEFTLKKIYEAPKIKWTNLLNRRLQNWGGVPTEKVRKNKSTKYNLFFYFFANYRA